MIVRFITNKRQKEHLARLIGIGRFVNSKDIETLQNDPETFEFLINSIAELSYEIGGIEGMNIVKKNM